MLVDLHMHSHHSKCANPGNSILAMAEAACTVGLEGIGITDHLHPHISLEICADNREKAAQLDESGLKVWIGAEVDVLTFAGDITGTPELFETLDYVLAGVHHYHLNWVEGPDLSQSPTDILYFAHQNLMNTIRNPWVNAVGHPWVGLFKVFEFSYELMQREWIEEAGEEAKKLQTALEIPVWALFRDGQLDEAYLEHLARPLIRTGCPISTGTDAHQLGEIGQGIKELTRILREEGAAEDQLWSPSRLQDKAAYPSHQGTRM